MKTVDLKYANRDGKDYYTIVVDLENKNVFAVKNHGCDARLDRYLSEQFVIEHYLLPKRFRYSFSGNEINLTKIPKKYSKYQILNA